MKKLTLLCLQILILHSIFNAPISGRIIDSSTNSVSSSHLPDSTPDGTSSEKQKHTLLVKEQSSKNELNPILELIGNATKVPVKNEMYKSLKLRSTADDLNKPSTHSGGSDWKSLAISVFCGTPGDRRTKSKAVLDALMVSYPSYHWVVFVTEEENGWSYAYDGWECLDERSLCGPMDLLVWGRPSKGCTNDVDAAASLLQSGAMNDATELEEARDLMKSREYIYNLHYDLIFVFYSGVYNDYLVQTCANEENNVNSMYSFWSGELY